MRKPSSQFLRAILLLLTIVNLFCVARIQNYQVLNSSTASKLIGTWSSGSGRVQTGLGFFAPADRTFTQPKARGISYSFSEDGFWEQSLYISLPNPANPKCVESQLIWQHGNYKLYDNGTLLLTPFIPEGCQLVTSSCAGGNKTETTYNQMETWVTVDTWVEQVAGRTVDSLRFTDAWGNRRTNMYKIFDPPKMLPTQRLYVQVYGT